MKKIYLFLYCLVQFGCNLNAMDMIYKTVNVQGLTIFYREAGTDQEETILFLHGFPSSSHMYRDVMKDLAGKYHVIAPDYPGFGFSSAPSVHEFEYTFDNMSAIMEQFIDEVGLKNFHLFVQDYGSPVGFRIASKRPELVKSLVIQNANAYEEGFGEFASEIFGYHERNDLEGLRAFKEKLFSYEGIKEQYLSGVGDTTKIDPASYLLDDYFMKREGIAEIQHHLFDNYGSNIPRYPEWQHYFRTYQPPALIVWGKNDPYFDKAGAEAYLKDLKNVELHFFNSGHFLLEEYHHEVVNLIINFIDHKK